jgi:hypothetical protein
MSIAKSVEYIELTLSSATVSGALTQGQDVDYCVPYACCGTIFPTIADISVSDNNHLVIEKNMSASNNTNMHTFVVEYDADFVNVQHDSFYITNTSGTININPVDPYKSYVVSYYTKEFNSDSIIFDITSSGTLTYNKNLNTVYVSGHYYIMETVASGSQPLFSFSTTKKGLSFNLDEDVFYTVEF